MTKNLDKINILFILIISLSVNIYFGSIGVLPIDTFAFFDSANYINKGFLPFRDYWLSNGLFVDLMQSIFFKFFGSSWYVYLLHSSLVNFIFAIASYFFLKSEGLSKKSSLFYSISTSILAYPSAGVPFSDHHSLIFSIISIYFLILAFKKKSSLVFSFSIFLLFIAFLSKQIPAAFFIILVFVYVLFFSIKNKFFKFIYHSFFLFLLFAGIFFLLLKTNNIEIDSFLVQYIFFPLTIGSDRTDTFTLNIFLLSFTKEYKFFLVLSIIMIFQLYKSKMNKQNSTNIFFQTNTFFLFVVLISIINQELMKNQNILFFILPILCGIIHSQFLEKKNFLILIIILNSVLTYKYHERFNVNRKFMDIENLDKSNFVSATMISKRLKGLKWTSTIKGIKLDEEVNLIKKTISFLNKEKNESVIITYYQFINSEINHPVYPPNRWYTKDGVSFPLEKNFFHKNYVNFFRENLKKNKIKKIYTIYPLSEKSFNFIFKENCYETIKINDILTQHNLLNCFAK